MRAKFPTIDADRHVIEPLEMWPQYLPKAYHEHAPELLSLAPNCETIGQRLARLGEQALLPTPPVLGVRGRPILQDFSEAAYIEMGQQGAPRVAALKSAEVGTDQLSSMDAQGIDAALLIPSYGGYLVHDDTIEADLSRAYAQAYNRWIADYRSASPRRLIPAALVSRHRPEQMVDDLHTVLRQGIRTVMLRPNPVRGTTLGDPNLERFWSVCAAEDVPVVLHEGAHAHLAAVGADRFKSHFAKHACCHPMEAMLAFLSLLEAGVLERHPTLRFCLLEAGCSWLPHWLWRLDAEWKQMKVEVRESVKRPPSDYFKRQFWTSFEVDEVDLRDTVNRLGVDRFVFGTDYPHADHELDVASTLRQARNQLDGTALSKVLWDNPARFLGLDSVDLQRHKFGREDA